MITTDYCIDLLKIALTAEALQLVVNMKKLRLLATVVTGLKFSDVRRLFIYRST